VFEKVNTGGVALSVFELSTATFAADGFNLRADWYGDARAAVKGRTHRLAEKPLLKAVEPTEFLQPVTLLHSYELRQADLKGGKSTKESSAVNAKRDSVLMLPLAAYRKWSEPLTNGFIAADRFLRSEGFHSPRYLPYRSQLIPLAAIMALLGDKWMQPLINAKLARWYWCGVGTWSYGVSIDSEALLVDPEARQFAVVETFRSSREPWKKRFMSSAWEFTLK
jgi:hypothetical protein